MRALACLCWVRVGVESVLCAADCIAETGTRPGGGVLVLAGAHTPHGAGHWSLVMSLKIQSESEDPTSGDCGDLNSWNCFNIKRNY